MTSSHSFTIYGSGGIPLQSMLVLMLVRAGCDSLFVDGKYQAATRGFAVMRSVYLHRSRVQGVRPLDLMMRWRVDLRWIL
jgi:hypothetical protein